MRRCVWIRLLPPCERPWTREPNQFRHPCLIDYVKRHRAKLVWAALTLVQNWLASGKPSFSGRPLGSFEAWSRTVWRHFAGGGHRGLSRKPERVLRIGRRRLAGCEVFCPGWWETYQTNLSWRPLWFRWQRIASCSQHKVMTLAWLARLGRWLARNEGRVFAATESRAQGFTNGQSCGGCLPQKERGRDTATGDLDTGAGDVDDPFGEDDLLQADGSPLAGDGDSVPAFTRGGTNSQNSQNSPERIYENPEPNIYENRRSELSEFREFLSPSEKRRSPNHWRHH
jgi:hypothetical protein